MMAADLSFRQHTTTFGVAILDRLYAMPRPLARVDDFYRARNEDLDAKTDDGLRAELRCVRRRLDYEADSVATAWLTARQDAMLNEMTCRRRGDGRLR